MMVIYRFLVETDTFLFWLVNYCYQINTLI